MCQARAVADGRLAVDRFADPVARRLLDQDELGLVDLARGEGAPADPRQRSAVGWLRSSAAVVVPRTLAIDEAVCASGLAQVVILGAGLDTRPWRLSCLREAVVYCIDHPASQAETTRRAVGLPVLAQRLVVVPVDLGEDGLGEALARSGHDASAPTAWVWEGVIPYLTPAGVSATAAAVAARSAAGSVLVVNYQSRSAVTVWGRRLGRVLARLFRLDDPLGDEPWRSLWTPADIEHLLLRHGFVVDRDQDLLTVATSVGSPTQQRWSLASGRVLVAHRPAAPDALLR